MKHKQLLILLLLVSACSSQNLAPVTPTTAVATNLQILVASDDFAVGISRVPFVFFDGPNRTADVTTVTVQAFDLSSDPPVAGWQGEAQSFNDYEVPYWVIYPEIPAAGVWGMNAVVTFPDGSTNDIQFAIQVDDAFNYPTVGEMAIPTENRTTPDHALQEISSDPEPEPSFYETTITQALSSGRPTVIMFATPAFCQTAVCAPAVDSLKTVHERYPDELNYIQVEIFEDFQEGIVAESVSDWRLASEPWTYVVDGSGVITGRFGGPISPQELLQAIEDVLSE